MQNLPDETLSYGTVDKRKTALSGGLSDSADIETSYPSRYT
jgi:hypothetical protein